MLTIVSLITIYIFSVAFLCISNRDRFPLVRQLADYSTFMMIFNLPAYLLSKVPMKAFIKRRYYPELPRLDDIIGKPFAMRP